MKLLSKILLFTIVVTIALASTGCGSTSKDADGRYIIDAKTAAGLMGKDGVAFIDMQNAEEYQKGHVKGAVSIERKDIVINIPVDNMLAPKGKIEDVMGRNGISNSTEVIVYDNMDNMDAARLWWTLMVYGHENVKVVSGGLKALQKEGIEITEEVPQVSEVKYTAKDKNTNMVATIKDVKDQVNEPQKNVVLLDTRTQEEYDQGTIPGSILMDYSNNNYKDGTYKSVQNIKIQYIENKITPDKTVIMYCKTSIRAAQTYLALYNAGYTNLKIYDGAWLEWSANKTLPVQTPTGNKVESNNKDNS